MAVIITEILGTDSFSGSRLTINANFNSLKSEIDTLEAVFNISLTSGNLDVSAATGGQIKGKVGAFNSIQLPANGSPTITLTGSSGLMTATSLTLGSTLTATTVNVSLGGSVTNQGSLLQQGQADFLDVVALQGGLVNGYLDIGVANTHTVLNSDRIIIFDGTASPALLTLSPDGSLLDGHTITLVKKGTGACGLDVANIVGYNTGSIDFDVNPFKSSITLMYSVTNAGWIVIGQNMMTLI